MTTIALISNNHTFMFTVCSIIAALSSVAFIVPIWFLIHDTALLQEFKRQDFVQDLTNTLETEPDAELL
jgi:hypothetical protein